MRTSGAHLPLEAGDAYLSTQNPCLDCLEDGIAIIQNQVVQYLNASLAEMVGIAVDKIRHQPWDSAITSSEIHDALHASPPPTGTSQIGTLTDAAGTRMWIRFKLDPLTYQGRPAWLLVIRDLSEYRRMEEKLIKVKNLESIAALSGGIAHDYNNLLTVIMGNISLAQAHLDPDQDIYGLLEEAQKASEVARDLTEKLITFSRGGLPNKEVLRVAPLIRVAAEFTLSGSNLKCEYDLSDEIWPVEVDKKQISHVIYHLVMNAREAMPGGGIIQIRAQNIEHRDPSLMLTPGRYVRISVCDQGPGISADIRDKIFDPYFSTKERGAEKGLGLGLSICYSIINRHRGMIDLSGDSGQGACFNIYLPAAEHDAAVSVPDTPASRHGKLDRPARILIMDDEAMIRQLIGKIFQRMGHQTSFSKTGEEAIALYQEALQAGKPFDVVILDLTVKNGMGGKEAIGHLKRLNPDVRAIVSSGYSNDPAMMNYERYGFVGVVSKPYNYNELRRKLAEMIAVA
ncbi:MAG: ATP-binding protein [Desulfobacterales bacterium]